LSDDTINWLAGCFIEDSSLSYRTIRYPEWMSRKLKSNENPNTENNLPFPDTARHFPDLIGPYGNSGFILSAKTPGETGSHLFTYY
jgi:hypothetical protein